MTEGKQELGAGGTDLQRAAKWIRKFCSTGDRDTPEMACSTWTEQEIIEAINEKFPPAATEAPVGDTRTDKDYAIEFGGYLADAAEAFLKQTNIWDEKSVKEGCDEGDTDVLNDHWRALENAIGEFRKRANRAASSSRSTPQDQELAEARVAAKEAGYGSGTLAQVIRNLTELSATARRALDDLIRMRSTPLGENDTVEYWRSRATTAELKLQEFSKLLDVCRNPNHALVDGSPSPHEIGPSCMAEPQVAAVSEEEERKEFREAIKKLFPLVSASMRKHSDATQYQFCENDLLSVWLAARSRKSGD